MDNELGEFVGKGFALLRDRLKEVEAREAIKGTDGKHGDDGKDGSQGEIGPQGEVGPQGETGPQGDTGTAGQDGNSVKGDRGDDGLQGVQGTAGEQGIDGAQGPQGPKGAQGKDGQAATGDHGRQGDKGDDGGGISEAKIDKRGHLMIMLDDGRKIDAGKVKGKDGQSYQGMIASGPAGGGAGPGSGFATAGLAVLDFGAGAKTATVDVTGLLAIEATSVILCKTQIVATAEHPVDDLLADPIRLEALSIVAGTGFTIYGEMENAPANGTYNVQWTVI